MTDEIKRAVHRVACGLRDVRAARSGVTAAELLARREALPGMFADPVYREVWIAKRTQRRLARRRRIWL